MSFAWNLKMLREEERLTQEKLAERIGVSQKTLSSWETGRTEPTIGDVIKLCHTLNCTMERITGTKTRDIGDISFEDILVKMQSLSDKELENICSIANIIVTQRKEIEEMERKQHEHLVRIRELQEKIESLKLASEEGSHYE